MRLSNLFEHIPFRPFGAKNDPEITGLFYDSRCVRSGGLFFALPGMNTDGTQFIDQAVARGACAVVSETPCGLPEGIVGIQVQGARQAMARAAVVFYGHPTAGIPVVGITGTNGKTTVAYLVEGILQAGGRHPAVLGTIEYRLGERRIPSLHTTPESVDLQRILSDFRNENADAAVMEVSSHALAQHRVTGVEFNVGVFTNLTPEHLDYHGNMEDYFASKGQLFSLLEAVPGSRAVINVDDPWGKRLAARISNPLTCGMAATAEVRPRNVSLSLEGIEGEVETPAGMLHLRSPLLGEFNLHNLLCAAGAGLALGLSPERIAEGLAGVSAVPGRLERVENGIGAQILVDYAHTGDALEKALCTLAALKPRRILTVFGCGGDRDRGKRPVMGEVAGRYSDLAIVTSDNPRSENPSDILQEIRGGIHRVHPMEWSRREAEKGEGKGFTVIPDRREAIGFAVSLLQAGDLLLVAGKGHEDYQIIGNERFHFDDREEVRRALLSRGE